VLKIDDLVSQRLHFCKKDLCQKEVLRVLLICIVFLYLLVVILIHNINHCVYGGLLDRSLESAV
jgi:hypothetical protein